MSEPVLCYAEEGWAWFTTKPLMDQWGDDWNDAPYEHNAGRPYAPCWHREDGGECDCDICKRDWHADGTPKWRVIRVGWTGDLVLPAHDHMNSPWSVEDINAHAVPWLACPPWCDHGVRIYAGATLEEFVGLVQRASGAVYFSAEEAP